MKTRTLKNIIRFAASVTGNERRGYILMHAALALAEKGATAEWHDREARRLLRHFVKFGY